jgi:hypothetical protein
MATNANWENATGRIEANSALKHGMATKEDKSSTGHVWVAGFHHVMARSRLARSKNYERFISFTL